MSKELEYLKTIGNIVIKDGLTIRDLYGGEYYDIKEALERLETIDNNARDLEKVERNDALECLKKIYSDYLLPEYCGTSILNEIDKLLNNIKQALIKAQEHSIEEKMPIKDLVSKHIINHNSIVEIYEQEKDDTHYSKRIYRCMAWEMEKHQVGNRKLKYIFSALAEGKDDFDSDRICIEVEDE